jgi:hypothetical protein
MIEDQSRDHQPLHFVCQIACRWKGLRESFDPALSHEICSWTFFLLVLALTAFDLVNFLFESYAGTVNGKRWPVNSAINFSTYLFDFQTWMFLWWYGHNGRCGNEVKTNMGCWWLLVDFLETPKASISLPEVTPEGQIVQCVGGLVDSPWYSHGHGHFPQTLSNCFKAPGIPWNSHRFLNQLGSSPSKKEPLVWRSYDSLNAPRLVNLWIPG